MNGYRGEFEVDVATTEFAGYTPADWALRYVGRYGQIDGGHHKTWVLDQVARILKGTPVIVREARWDDGVRRQSELRFRTGDPSPAYEAWVDGMKGGADERGRREYDYDVGIPP